MLQLVNVRFWERIHNKEDLGVHKTDDYNCRCDICGDSQKSKNKKRLHLYKKDTYDDDSVKCFNCGYTGTMYSYIKNYHPEYLNEYINETSTKYLKELDITNIKTEEKPVEIETFDINLPKADTIPSVADYICSRGGNPSEFYYSSGEFKCNDKEFNLENYIIYPNIKDNKIVSFYSRSLDSKRFYVYAPTEGTKHVNYFTADRNRPVIICEGLFDMLCIPAKNKIAILGSAMSDDKVREFNHIIWCLDNDNTGKKEMLKFTKNPNYKFVIWSNDQKYKHIKDINEIYMSGVNMVDFIKSHTYDNVTAEVLLRMY